MLPTRQGLLQLGFTLPGKGMSQVPTQPCSLTTTWTWVFPLVPDMSAGTSPTLESPILYEVRLPGYQNTSNSAAKLSALGIRIPAVMADDEMSMDQPPSSAPSALLKQESEGDTQPGSDPPKLPPCDQCRRRKVKCDGRKIPCERSASRRHN